MKYRRKHVIIGSITVLFLLGSAFCTASSASASAVSAVSVTSESNTTVTQKEAPAGVLISAPVTSKASSQSIRISWSSSKDDVVKRYYVMRRETVNNVGVGKWETIAKVNSDKIKNGPKNSYTDQLASSEPQQYEYKICTLSEDGSIDTRKADYAEETNGRTSLGTNIKICIDPGHFGTRNNNYDYTGKNGEYPYSEAKFTLKIGKALQEELKQFYGIDSYMTRTTSKISLTYKGKTYTNKKLDDSNIAIRGYMAGIYDCDFFISLHTNSTVRQKNPWNQPKEVNKVYVFVNNKARKADLGMRIANSIGLNVTAYNKEVGIQDADFVTRTKKHAADYGTLAEDTSNTDGTVVYRKGSGGADYYGVLRGSSDVGVQGILVEHAFHVTSVMREQATASKELYENWATCDAYGIAYGFGLVEEEEPTLVREALSNLGETEQEETEE